MFDWLHFFHRYLFFYLFLWESNDLNFCVYLVDIFRKIIQFVKRFSYKDGNWWVFACKRKISKRSIKWNVNIYIISIDSSSDLLFFFNTIINRLVNIYSPFINFIKYFVCIIIILIKKQAIWKWVDLNICISHYLLYIFLEWMKYYHW